MFKHKLGITASQDRNAKVSAGFTLIELLVVIAIIGTLASVVLASLNSAREKGREAKRTTDMQQVVVALEKYHSDMGEYPQSSGTTDAACGGIGWCLATVVENDLMPLNFLPQVPQDPTYVNTTTNYRYCGGDDAYTMIRWSETIDNWCHVNSPAPDNPSCGGTNRWMDRPAC